MTVLSEFTRVSVIGGGAFGTALACAADRAGVSVCLWARDPNIVTEINKRHENAAYLPDVALPERLRATADMSEAANADAILLAVPAQYLRAILIRFAPELDTGVPLIICAKGIENSSLALMSEIVAELAPGSPLAVLSGPSFAADIARGLPTAVTLAADNQEIGAALVRAIGTATFRPYLSDDLIGAEVGGAIKNVIAIACGISDGRGFGDSARAALMTRGLAEITRLAIALGGHAHTMMGLAGIGDLALTCNSRQSRNFTLGFRLGQGESLADIFSGSRSVFEGAHTVGAAAQLAEREGVEMPIAAVVDAILNRKADIDETIAELLARPFTREET